MDQHFANAIEQTGPAYLQAEAALRGGGAPAAATLRGHLSHPDPVMRTLAQTLLEWNEGRVPEYQEALDYLEGLPQRLARTPVKALPATGVAAELEERYGDRVANLLALRLLKQAEDWTDWQVGAVLFYLQAQPPRPEVTPILIRFAVDTPSDRYRRAAVEVLRNQNAPDLAAKLATERQRLQQTGADLPPELADLEPAPPTP